MTDNDETTPSKEKFDPSSFPPDTFFHERRKGRDRRDRPITARDDAAPPKAPPERRAKKERRRRIDPTTFEKQYTEDELEFMNAMQHFKVQTGKMFPSHGEVLKVATSLGYRKLVLCDEHEPPETNTESKPLADDLSMALTEE